MNSEALSEVAPPPSDLVPERQPSFNLLRVTTYKIFFSRMLTNDATYRL